MCFQKELREKDQELRRATNSVLDISGEDEEVLLKRIEMTESAHKEERNKSNLLEDVSFNNCLHCCSLSLLFILGNAKNEC